jgi:hypothetical protein
MSPSPQPYLMTHQDSQDLAHGHIHLGHRFRTAKQKEHRGKEHETESENTKYKLPRVQVKSHSCDNACKVLSTKELVRLSAQEFYWRLVTQIPSA